ncbi:hypothetical protein ABZ669_29560 [Streptomyces hirsutus]|uniref:hypothetical protein n=1 Tax=Streptomyces hirsutus TaxID=35620 RepID=UPI0033D5CABB
MLLGLVACAMLCGVRSVRGVVRWARGQDAGVLAVLARVDGDVLDAAVHAFVQAHATDPPAGLADDPPMLQLAADGKTVRGAVDENGDQLHLLGVYQTDPGVMGASPEWWTPSSRPRWGSGEGDRLR